MSPTLLPTAAAEEFARTASAPDAPAALDDSLIAGFTPVEIAQMTDAELARAIRSARLPLSSGIDEHLEFHDRRTLERLAYLARRCCQARTAAVVVKQTIFYGGE